MGYGKVVGPVAPAVILPFTGDNIVLLIVAASLTTVGVGVLVASMLIARKKNLSEVK